jgi:endonuclease/exonuclease/phosphatase family metal-dependent hydrolase
VRLANWVRLIDKNSGKEFRVVNTHLDHLGLIARENQAKIIVEDSNAYAPDYPQILTGDMNCDVNNKAIHEFKNGGWVDTYSAVHGPQDPGNTYHGFIGPKYIVPEKDMTKGKMDWIFTRGNFKATDAQIIRDDENGRYPSDHYFVSANIAL